MYQMYQREAILRGEIAFDYRGPKGVAFRFTIKGSILFDQDSIGFLFGTGAGFLFPL